MTHYEVLGISPAADVAEIRRAYLRLARDHHPDRHTESPIVERVAAERRMQAINAAWRELGDPGRRRRYDDSLRTERGEATIADEAPPSWRPYDDGWEIDLDDDEAFGDAGARRPTGGRLLALLPVSCLAAGVAALVVGALVGLGALLAVGIVAIVLSGLLFVVAPLAVILESRRHDPL